MDEKPNYYAVIPANVRYDATLRANEKLLYGEITALAQKTGECWASNKYFSELYEVKPNAIATWIRHLKEREYIIVDYEYKGKEIDKRVIKIGGIQKDNTYSQKDRGVFTKEYGGIIQKGEENNTSINNTSNNNITTTDTLFDLLEQNGFILTPIQYEVVSKWNDDELTRYAIKKAVLNNKFNINYIDKILYSYEKENIKTVEQAIAKDEEFNNKRDSYYKNKYTIKESRYEREKRLLEEMLKDE